MSLNIKNQRVHDLAREAARVTGKSQTGAIEEALERLLKEYGEDPAKRALEERLARIRETAQAWRDANAGRPVLHPDDLYDPETGLPA